MKINYHKTSLEPLVKCMAYLDMYVFINAEGKFIGSGFIHNSYYLMLIFSHW